MEGRYLYIYWLVGQVITESIDDWVASRVNRICLKTFLLLTSALSICPVAIKKKPEIPFFDVNPESAPARLDPREDALEPAFEGDVKSIKLGSSSTVINYQKQNTGELINKD